MNAYTPPDKIEIYAAALQSDIGAERFEVVEGGKNFVSNGVVLCPNCHRVAHEQSGGGEV